MARRSRARCQSIRGPLRSSTRQANFSKKKGKSVQSRLLVLLVLICIVASLLFSCQAWMCQALMFGIFLAAILLWVTEAVPLAGTAWSCPFLEVLFISDHAAERG